MLAPQQLYFVTRVETDFDGFRDLSFNNGWTAQLLIRSLYEGRIIFLPVHNALAGIKDFHRAGGPRLPVKLRSIEYIILAKSGNQEAMAWEAFIHPFKKPVWLHPDGLLRSEHQLFKREKLDFLFDSKDFGNMMGIQFVA